MKKLLTLLILLCAVVSAQAAWYVSGSFNSWGADEMTHAGNGIYEYSITLDSDSQFKVRDSNSNWDHAYPDNNYYLSVSGTKDVTIYFNSHNNHVYTNIDHTLTYVYVVKSNNTSPYLHMWSFKSGQSDSNNTGDWPGIAMTSTETVNGTTYWKAGPFTNLYDGSANVKMILNNNGSNQTADIERSGYFVCTYDGTSSAYDELPRVVGHVAGNDWSLGYPMSKSGSNYTLTCTPPWNESLYKIVRGTTWYGYGSEESNVTAPGDYTISTSGNNMLIRLARPVTFTLNTSTWNLNVATDDDDLSLDYLSTYGNATYSNHTFTTTDDSWSGVWANIGTSSTLSGDFLVVKKTETNQELYVYVEDTDGNKIKDTTFDAATTTCILPLDNTKNIKEVQLKNPVAGSITLTDLYVTSKRSVTLNTDGTNGWATFAAASPVSFANQDNVQVNIITKEGNVLRKEEVASKEVPAGSAVLLYYEGLTSGTSVNVPVLNAAPAALDGSNVLLSSGAEGLAVTEAKRYYILGNGTSGVGFYPVQTSTTIAAYKGYIDFGTSGLAPQFLWFDGETTAIDALNNESETLNDGPVYDLSGRKVNGQLHRGIYVQNGKKFIVK